MVMAMTKKERQNPDIIDASRRKRIAKGSGLQVSDVNNLLQQFRAMRQMMRGMGKGEMPNLGAMMGGGGAMGPGFGGVNSRKSVPPPRNVDPLAAYKSGKPGGQRPPKKKK
jgi:signal recognition particle subunit SRP54